MNKLIPQEIVHCAKKNKNGVYLAVV